MWVFVPLTEEQCSTTSAHITLGVAGFTFHMNGDDLHGYLVWMLFRGAMVNCMHACIGECTR